MDLLRFEDELELIAIEPLMESHDAFKASLDDMVANGRLDQATREQILSASQGELGKAPTGRLFNKKYRVGQHLGGIKDSLHYISRVRDEAARVGLEGLVQKEIKAALGGDERFDDIRRYGTEDDIEKELERMEQAGEFGDPNDSATKGEREAKRKNMGERLAAKGRWSPDELETVAIALQERVVPKIDEYKGIIRSRQQDDPELDQIMGGTEVDKDLKVTYMDVTGGAMGANQPVKRTIDIPASISMSERLRLLKGAITNMAPDKQKFAKDRFTTAYRKISEHLGEIMPGDDNKPQRIYTATKYAFYTVAPELDLNYEQQKQKRSEAERKQREEEAKKLAEQQAAEQEGQRKEQEKQAEEEKKRRNEVAAIEALIQSGKPVKPEFLLNSDASEMAHDVAKRGGITQSEAAMLVLKHKKDAAFRTDLGVPVETLRQLVQKWEDKEQEDKNPKPPKPSGPSKKEDTSTYWADYVQQHRTPDDKGLTDEERAIIWSKDKRWGHNPYFIGVYFSLLNRLSQDPKLTKAGLSTVGSPVENIKIIRDSRAVDEPIPDVMNRIEQNFTPDWRPGRPTRKTEAQTDQTGQELQEQPTQDPALVKAASQQYKKIDGDTSEARASRYYQYMQGDNSAYTEDALNQAMDQNLTQIINRSNGAPEVAIGINPTPISKVSEGILTNSDAWKISAYIKRAAKMGYKYTKHQINQRSNNIQITFRKQAP